MGTVKTLLILGMSAILLSACLGVQPVPAATPTSPAPTQPAATVGPTTPVTPVDANGGSPLIVWEGPDGSKLSAALVTSYFGRAGDASLNAAPYVSPLNSQRLGEWAQKYQSFSAQTPAGKVTFNGSGQTPVSPAEQRMMAEWSKLRFDEAQSGRSGAAWGAALSFARNGGIAGFCDTLAVYRDGSVKAENCKSQRAEFLLNAAQLAQLYDWLDTYQHTEYNHSDPPGVADGMSVSFVLEGTGQKTAGEDAVRAMTDFASLLTMQAK
jgi:hypothetical protein